MIHASQRTRKELEIAYRRYETVRKMNGVQFASLCRVNQQGIPFDTLVDSVSADIERGKPMWAAVDDIMFRTNAATKGAKWQDVVVEGIPT